MTDDQTMVVTNNGSVVIGLNTQNGQTSLSYLPARNGDIIDGVLIHPNKKYVIAIINGSFISVFNMTSSKRQIFNANSTIKNILLPQTYLGRSFTLYYSTSDFNLSRVDINVPGKVTLTWHMKFKSDVNVIDSDDSSFKIVAGLNNGTILVLNPLNGEVISTKNFGAPITSLKISSFGFFATVTTSDGMFYLIRTDTLYVLQSLSFGSNKGISSAISDDGEKTSVGLSNGTIFYLKYLTGETGKIVVSSSSVNIVCMDWYDFLDNNLFNSK
jgi:outer membrane protein assembly factor BamB